MKSAPRDHLNRPIAVVTGIGIVTALGRGKDDNWQALTQGRSGVHAISRFSTEGLRTTIAADVDLPDAPGGSMGERTFTLATLAASEATDEAGLGTTGDFPGPLVAAVPPFEIEWSDRIAIARAVRAAGRTLAGGAAGANAPQDCYGELLAASAAGDFTTIYETSRRAYAGEKLADRFGTRGQPVSISTACASGGTALQYAVDAIRRGETDAALCVGADASVTPESLVRFSLLSALSTRNSEPEKAARPFSKSRDGFVMGEGAAALVIESLDAARARGAKVLGVVMGCGEQADNFHRTRSRPDGSAIIGALRRAIADAGIDPSAIDYVNPHGTGTSENDKMEYLSLAALLGERVSGVPVSSNKSMIGHTLSAAGVIEAAFSLMTIASGVLPPTINYDMPDPEIPLDVVPNVKRAQEVRTVLSNSFGFGGQNVSLVLAAEPV